MRNEELVETRTVQVTSEQIRALGEVIAIAEGFGGESIQGALDHLVALGAAWWDAQDAAEPGSTR